MSNQHEELAKESHDLAIRMRRIINIKLDGTGVNSLLGGGEGTNKAHYVDCNSFFICSIIEILKRFRQL